MGGSMSDKPEGATENPPRRVAASEVWTAAPMTLLTSKVLSPNAKVIALLIQSHVGPDGEAPFPGQRRLAEMSGLGERTVKRAIAELREHGFLWTQRRRKENGHLGVNTYHLNLQGPKVTPSPGVRSVPLPG